MRDLNFLVLVLDSGDTVQIVLPVENLSLLKRGDIVEVKKENFFRVVTALKKEEITEKIEKSFYGEYQLLDTPKEDISAPEFTLWSRVEKSTFSVIRAGQKPALFFIFTSLCCMMEIYE